MNINTLTPYPPQRSILSGHEPILALFGGIQTGKSVTGAFKIACDATGVYPDWYMGPRTERGIEALVMSNTSEVTRDVCQRLLIGESDGSDGYLGGFIDRGCSIDSHPKSFLRGACDSIRVKHAPSGTESRITFSSFECIQHLSAGVFDRIWIDNECGFPILQEAHARVIPHRGQVIITMCPLDGVTRLVGFIMSAPQDVVRLEYMTWDDARHLDAELKKDAMAIFGVSPDVTAARLSGRPVQLVVGVNPCRNGSK